jgi:tRNA-specific 2-thiouridylase
MEHLDIAVGMSGGVDSSVAAALLKSEGNRVVGVTMKLWNGPGSRPGGRHGCYGPGEEQDIEDARQVAAKLGIPFHVIDLSAEYQAEVLDYFRSEYRLGRTPNPCSRCNRMVKFGTLVKKARDHGVRFDYFATGHYAKVERAESDGRYVLKKAKDTGKDQTYFLALLSQEQLAFSLFPLGDRTKSEVRDLAAGFGLAVAGKEDSQDFVDSDLNMLADTENPGPILDRGGNEIGRHSGIGHHTIGQRKGLGISSSRPLYVTEIDPVRNAIVVGERSEVFGDTLVARDLNWIAINGLKTMKVKARIRYRHQEAAALVQPLGETEVLVHFEEPQMAITPGQTIVFYDEDTVLGGGIIDRTKE